ncbi:hypothetical protein [Bergeyella sp. RCAD1439]|uniref:hypothetical protein n=1 Tax=Bergeyella anatis TaxID=3113737 RepID=UPI002E199700|nr:hypothetical protein [Bergeyella sp. RCAD1439]
MTFKTGVLIFILIFVSKINAQQFPVNFDIDSLKSAKINPEKWNGKLISVQCAIKNIEKGPKKKPYYKCNIDNDNFIWIGSLMNDKDRLKLEENVRVLGYFSLIENQDKISTKYNTDKFHLLTFAVINLTMKKAYHLPGAETQFEEWKNGIIQQTDN